MHSLHHYGTLRLRSVKTHTPCFFCGSRFGPIHNSLLQRYTSTMEPHIMDSVREVIGLHKVSAGGQFRDCKFGACSHSHALLG